MYVYTDTDMEVEDKEVRPETLMSEVHNTPPRRGSVMERAKVMVYNHLQSGQVLSVRDLFLQMVRVLAAVIAVDLPIITSSRRHSEVQRCISNRIYIYNITYSRIYLSIYIYNNKTLNAHICFQAYYIYIYIYIDLNDAIACTISNKVKKSDKQCRLSPPSLFKTKEQDNNIHEMHDGSKYKEHAKCECCNQNMGVCIKCENGRLHYCAYGLFGMVILETEITELDIRITYHIEV